MVERCVRDAEAAGSSPVTSTRQGLEPNALRAFSFTCPKMPAPIAGIFLTSYLQKEEKNDRHNIYQWTFPFNGPTFC